MPSWRSQGKLHNKHNRNHHKEKERTEGAEEGASQMLPLKLTTLLKCTRLRLLETILKILKYLRLWIMLCVKQKLSNNASDKYFRAFNLCIIHCASGSSILHKLHLAKLRLETGCLQKCQILAVLSTLWLPDGTVIRQNNGIILLQIQVSLSTYHASQEGIIRCHNTNRYIRLTVQLSFETASAWLSTQGSLWRYVSYYTVLRFTATPDIVPRF